MDDYYGSHRGMAPQWDQEIRPFVRQAVVGVVVMASTFIANDPRLGRARSWRKRPVWVIPPISTGECPSMVRPGSKGNAWRAALGQRPLSAARTVQSQKSAHGAVRHAPAIREQNAIRVVGSATCNGGRNQQWKTARPEP